jgi:hypothetical protein
MSGQGNVASSLPEMTTYILRPFVCVFVAPVPLVCAHVFFSSVLILSKPGDPVTYPTCQGTSSPPTYNPILSPSSSSSTSGNLYTVATAQNSLSEIITVVWQEPHCYLCSFSSRWRSFGGNGREQCCCFCFILLGVLKTTEGASQREQLQLTACLCKVLYIPCKLLPLT